MSETKANILATVIEEIGGDTGIKSGKSGKMNTKNGVSSLNRYAKGQRNGKARRTKNVIVKLPSVNRQTDDENKVFPKGIESMRRTLEEIKEEAKENNLKTEKAQENESIGDKENVNQSKENSDKTPVVMTEASNRNKLGVTIEEVQRESSSDPIYGMFTRTNTERSLLSNRSGSVTPAPSNRNRRKESVLRPKSSRGWSKKDLDLFLPRKSFFGVHDNTLASAGFDIRSDEERKRPEWRRILKMHTEEELNPPQYKTEEEPTTNTFGMMDDDSEDELFGLENIETAVGGKDPASGSKGKKKHSSKKVVSTEKEEYKPLYDYLKYIADNPEEYIQAAKYSAKNTDHKHPSNLVRLGRAFRRGHHGAVRNNIFLHAISGLKPKTSDTGAQQRQTRNDKGGPKKETDGPDPSAAQDETEIEKLKTKAEKWMRNLTTQQYLKAKEMALKDVGEEDMHMSKWWLVFRNCHYLRIPSHMTE